MNEFESDFDSIDPGFEDIEKPNPREQFNAELLQEIRRGQERQTAALAHGLDRINDTLRSNLNSTAEDIERPLFDIKTLLVELIEAVKQSK